MVTFLNRFCKAVSLESFVEFSLFSRDLRFRVTGRPRKTSGRRWGGTAAPAHWQVRAADGRYEHLRRAPPSVFFRATTAPVFPRPSASEMGRMTLGGVSPFLSSAQQHRKCQYPGNGTGGDDEKLFLRKSCSYTYNTQPCNKTEGELTRN